MRLADTGGACLSHDERIDMAKRMQKLLVALAAFAALATGGAVFAQAQSQSAGGSENPAAGDRHNIKSGDQTTPDKPDAAATRHVAAKKAAAQQEPAGSTEKPGSEGSEQPGAEGPEQPGTESETAPDSDGPGGHADEPANANADHQFEGVE
jgi:hypothetical protein